MVWGAIGKGWRSPLIIIKGTLNSSGYINMLEENQIPEKLNEKYGLNNYFFQQDGATCHTAKFSVTWLRKKMNLVEHWPANSPDLSVIENLWGILKQRVSDRDPNSIAELETILREEWNKISQETIDSLMDSIPERFKLDIDKKGGTTGHLLHKIRERKFINEELADDEEAIDEIESEYEEESGADEYFNEPLRNQEERPDNTSTVQTDAIEEANMNRGFDIEDWNSDEESFQCEIGDELRNIDGKISNDTDGTGFVTAKEYEPSVIDRSNFESRQDHDLLVPRFGVTTATADIQGIDTIDESYLTMKTGFDLREWN
jgi:hypothetical protein